MGLIDKLMEKVGIDVGIGKITDYPDGPGIGYDEMHQLAERLGLLNYNPDTQETGFIPPAGREMYQMGKLRRQLRTFEQGPTPDLAQILQNKGIDPSRISSIVSHGQNRPPISYTPGNSFRESNPGAGFLGYDSRPGFMDMNGLGPFKGVSPAPQVATQEPAMRKGFIWDQDPATPQAKPTAPGNLLSANKWQSTSEGTYGERFAGNSLKVNNPNNIASGWTPPVGKPGLSSVEIMPQRQNNMAVQNAFAKNTKLQSGFGGGLSLSPGLAGGSRPTMPPPGPGTVKPGPMTASAGMDSQVSGATNNAPAPEKPAPKKSAPKERSSKSESSSAPRRSKAPRVSDSAEETFQREPQSAMGGRPMRSMQQERSYGAPPQRSYAPQRSYSAPEPRQISSQTPRQKAFRAGTVSRGITRGAWGE